MLGTNVFGGVYIDVSSTKTFLMGIGNGQVDELTKNIKIKILMKKHPRTWQDRWIMSLGPNCQKPKKNWINWCFLHQAILMYIKEDK